MGEILNYKNGRCLNDPLSVNINPAWLVLYVRDHYEMSNSNNAIIIPAIMVPILFARTNTGLALSIERKRSQWRKL